MTKKYLSLLFVLLLTVTSFAQPKLVILCAAAHPDDEDGAALAYYSKLYNIKAYTIFYTRGEGGQNEIGPELYDDLGRIREEECIQAAHIQSSQAFFLGFLDFGYSKTAKETFKIWGGEDSVLERVVYAIRTLRPDVIITNHDTITTEPLRQHGNHQAVGITIYKAFTAAADPNYHPEQLNGWITPWQVKKLFIRVYDTTRTKDIYTLDVKAKDPATGKTIEDITIEALSLHRTQGMDKIDWKNATDVSKARRYELVKSSKMYPTEGNDLFSGITSDSSTTKPFGYFQSYETVYNYQKITYEDSLKILKNLQFKSFFGFRPKIGYVKTYDNTIENILKAFQIDYNELDSNSLAAGKLDDYSVILLDIRAYLYRPDLALHNNRILEYVKNGGNVVCFYNKPSDFNHKNFSPYPLFLTSKRVTEEDAPVTVLVPSHNFFGFPHKINPVNWSGWTQERNIYLPSDDTNKTSSKYQKLLSMNDENDPVPSTSLLYADYGQGFYTYCSLALYRQLKVFHEGALKLFLNMVYQKNFIERELDTIK